MNIKLGCSYRPEDRIRDLSKELNMRVYLLRAIKGSYEVENALHKKFAHLKTEHGREYFLCDPSIMKFFFQERQEVLSSELRTAEQILSGEKRIKPPRKFYQKKNARPIHEVWEAYQAASEGRI